MSLYSEFSILFPYLKSVRKLEKYLVFDVEFSKVWKLPKKYVNEERVIETKSEDINLRSISFVSEFNEKSVTDTIVNIKSIIAYNKEREEKERLFETKVNELKRIFEKSDLNNLQDLKFEIIKQKITLDDEEEDRDENGETPKLV
jgi:uncharacterized protein (DUF2344 family)